MFIFLQKISPQHGYSRLLGRLAHLRCPVFKNWAIRRFIRYFNVDLTESEITDIRQFPSFNDFFIRRLKPEARPLPAGATAIACPADGVISELGSIHAGRLLQAKGRYYELNDLFGGHAEIAQPFAGGEFFTVYLAPKDYHRVHIPIAGTLRQMIYVPGKLFSVNAASVNGIPRLFARNERVICLFTTAAGPMAVIFVGAMLIGGVVTSWQNGRPVMPVCSKISHVETFPDSAVVLQRGDELGYFQWGSTAIVLFGPDCTQWQTTLKSGDLVRMGQAIGNLVTI